MKSRARARAGPRSRGFSAHASPRLMASYRLARLVRALAFSSLVRGAAVARDDPAIGWRRLASAALRLGVGRPLAASAGERGLVSAGPSGLCAPGESWAVPSVAPALRRRNTGIAYSGGHGGSSPLSQQNSAKSAPGVPGASPGTSPEPRRWGIVVVRTTTMGH